MQIRTWIVAQVRSHQLSLLRAGILPVGADTRIAVSRHFPNLLFESDLCIVIHSWNQPPAADGNRSLYARI